jgi:predicted permease
MFLSLFIVCFCSASNVCESMFLNTHMYTQINMLMLGSTLTETIEKMRTTHQPFLWKENLAVAFGKLMLQPFIATMSVLLLHHILPMSSNSSSRQEASLYFAMLIVTCTPTANNVNVMAQIGGVNKDAIALFIFTQYMLAPFTITFWVSIFQYIVKDW